MLISCKQKLMEKSDLVLGQNFNDQEKYYLFCLSQVSGLGSHTICRWLNDGLKPSDLWLQPERLPAGFGRLLRQHQSDNKWLEQINREFPIYQNCLAVLDDEYPGLLKNIYDPPLFLFYRGNKKLLSSNYLLTIVGSRRLTNYHLTAVKKIIADLANTPLILVSGLALGIDALIHQQALTNNLPTIGVLGSGLNKGVFYPSANQRLADDILAHDGLLLSEFPDNTSASLYTFPLRNRILAGLSRLSVVISGAAKSGTLITAQIALEEGRELLALPGNINLTLSQGPNNLIKQGAGLLTGAEEILKVYNLKQKQARPSPSFTDPQLQLIYDLLQLQPLTANQLADKLNLPLTKISQLISRLELLGVIAGNQLNQLEII